MPAISHDVSRAVPFHPLVLAVQLLLGVNAPAAGAPMTPEPVLPDVKVSAQADGSTEDSGRYGVRSAAAATRLELPLRETPQSISVVPRPLIDDFSLNDVNDLLTIVTGVNVERVEPDRSYFSVRGFEVSNFQIDGVGLPFATGDQIGNLDTALYDRVEVLRGANGLLSSTGNPSATANFVRKRPTGDMRANAALTLGSWNTRRADLDVSGPINAAGSVRGRFTVAAQQGDSYLDRYSLAKHLFSGIVEADLAPGTTLTLGHSQQRNRPKGVMWGALPMFYADGSATHYATSASSAPDWSYWNSDDTQTFAELAQRLGNGWQAKASLTRRVLESDAELLFVVGPDPATGTGMTTFPSKYGSRETQWIADAYLSGPIMLGGRRHDLVLGINGGKSDNNLRSSDDDGGLPLTEGQMLAGNFPRPAFDQGLTGFAEFHNRRSSLYALARWNLADSLKLTTGANVTCATSNGIQYGVVHDYRETKVTPYAGATWAFDPRYSLYASYGRIYNPQHQTDLAGAVLPPVEGSNAELGLKGEWMQGRLNGSFAVFQVKQDNTAESAGFVVDPDSSDPDGSGRTYYRGVNATSTGVELDLSGTLAPGWEVTGGYTQLRIEDADGAAVRTYVPRKTLRLTTGYRVPALRALKLGASLKWQSDFQRTDAAVVTRQAAYALLGLSATYEFTPQLSMVAKLNNVTDKRYLNSLMWPGQTFYGAPRNGSLALRWIY